MALYSLYCADVLLRNCSFTQLLNIQMKTTLQILQESEKHFELCIFLNSFGDRSFGAASLGIWNSLPCGLRTLDISYKHFKTLLKTYVFD